MKHTDLMNAYNEIIAVLNKHKNIIKLDIESIKKDANLHLFRFDIMHVYRLNVDLNNITNTEYNRIDNNQFIMTMGPKSGRTIAISKDKTQPDNELIYSLQFATGGYIFTDSLTEVYPKELWNNFWNELLTYQPDFIDEVNKNLYWKIENAERISHKYKDILKKYMDLKQDYVKNMEIIKLEKRLKELKK